MYNSGLLFAARNTTAQPAFSPGGVVLSGSSASAEESFQLSRFSCGTMINSTISLTDNQRKSKTSEPNCCWSCRIVCGASFFPLPVTSHTCVPRRGHRPHSEAPSNAADGRSLSKAATDGPSVAQLITKIHCGTAFFSEKRGRGSLMTRPDVFQMPNCRVSNVVAAEICRK